MSTKGPKKIRHHETSCRIRSIDFSDVGIIQHRKSITEFNVFRNKYSLKDETGVGRLKKE